MDALAWMAWTPATAAFFVAVGLGLTAMTVAERRWPTEVRRGFLPMATSRGDRFFIALLTSAFVHLAWLALTDWWLPLVTVLCVGWLVVLLRWG